MGPGRIGGGGVLWIWVGRVRSRFYGGSGSGSEERLHA